MPTGCRSRHCRFRGRPEAANQHYLKTDDPQAIAPEFEWHLRQAGLDPAKGPAAADLIVALRDRVQTLKEMAERAAIWFGPITEWDDKAVVKHLKKNVEDFWVCFLNLVKEHHGVWTMANALGK